MGAKTGSWRAVVSALASALVVVGTCGGGGGGCGGGGGTGGGTSSTSASSSSSSSSGASSGGTAEPYTGSVILADEAFSGSTIHSSVIEILATSSASGPACSGGTQSGSCCYEPPPATSSSGGLPTAYSAGTITVADGSTTIGTLPFASGAYAVLDSATTPAFTWNPGDSLTVSAPGATIDSFNATVKAPGLIAGLTPSFTAPAITLASDWTVTWTPDTQSGETMIVTVTSQGTPAKGEVSCTVADSAATVTVPAALLGNLTGATKASVIAVRYGGANATDSNATIHVLAQVEVGGTATLH
jgi:hypothetical protein